MDPDNPGSPDPIVEDVEVIEVAGEAALLTLEGAPEAPEACCCFSCSRRSLDSICRHFIRLF